MEKDEEEMEAKDEQGFETETMAGGAVYGTYIDIIYIFVYIC